MKALMTLEEAARETPLSPQTLRRAVHTKDPKSFPPPLRAKRDSKGRILIADVALREWIDSFPDA